MAAEAVSSEDFAEAFDQLDAGKQIEIDFAIYAIEEDPAWKPPHRYLAPAGSRWSGFIADLSVDGYGIIYRIVDLGAAVELWLLFELPGHVAHREPKIPWGDPPPMM